VGVALALLFVVAVGGAWAADIDGKITSVDTANRTIQLDYNTVIAVAEGIAMDNLKEGANVKASYEERGGQKVATQVQVTP
jgi:Cu/Ag efflux protein CusF